ncbi:phage minor capsid protein [Saccharopolyspora cebuensis]|uniref:Phage minor capsid protein n=1 Tax=Saccharopolyspora cebuensis TaxID=418759 RepID=A0ABV4CHM1_9PSEU
MPVPPEQIDRIAATVADLYRPAETQLAATMARHLAGDLDSDMTAPQWADRKLSAVRSLRASASAILAALQSDAGRALREAVADAFRAGWRSVLAELPDRLFPRSQLGERARAAAEDVPGFAAIEALATAVHADVGARSANVLGDVVDGFRGVVAAASAGTSTGAQTRRQAAQSAFRRLVDRGLASFVDRSGRRRQLSSYVEMATRTVAQRAAVQGQTDRLDAVDVRLVYVSNASQECALCRPYEGRVLRLDDGPTGEIEVPHQISDEPTTVDVVATLDAARTAGFQHPNCRHSVSAYLQGVIRLPEQPTADPNGDEARQRQRAIERQIRKYKTRAAAALGDEARKAAGRKVRAWQAEMRQHLDAHPNSRYCATGSRSARATAQPAQRRRPVRWRHPPMCRSTGDRAKPARQPAGSNEPGPASMTCTPRARVAATGRPCMEATNDIPRRETTWGELTVSDVVIRRLGAAQVVEVNDLGAAVFVTFADAPEPIGNPPDHPVTIVDNGR